MPTRTDKVKGILSVLVMLAVGAGIFWGVDWYLKLPILPAKGGSVTEGIVGQPHLLNPLYADSNPVDQELVPLIYRGLVRFDSHNQAVGDLAKSWQIKEEGKVYEVELKRGQKWHDGEIVTARDVVFTYQITQNENYDGPEKTTFQEVEIKSNDPYHLQFTLQEPFSPFLENLSLGILPEHHWSKVKLNDLRNHPLNLKPIGSGEAVYSGIKFNSKIDNWIDWLDFKLPQGYLNKIRFKFYPSYTDLNTAVKLGEIDSTTFPSQNELNRFEKWPNFLRTTKTIWGRNLVIIYNTRNPKYDDKNTRETLSFFIEPHRQGIDQNKLPAALRSVGTTSPIPRKSWAYQKPASFLKQETSLPSAIYLKTLHDDTFLEIADWIKNQWEQEGDINVTVEPLTQIDLDYTLEKRDFEVLLLVLETGRDPDQYIYWHSTQSDYPQLNISGISHPRIDKALEKGRTSIKQEQRIEAYRDFQKYFNQAVPAVFLNHSELYYLTRTKINGLNLRNLWTPADRFENITDWYLREKRPLF